MEIVAPKFNLSVCHLIDYELVHDLVMYKVRVAVSGMFMIFPWDYEDFEHSPSYNLLRKLRVNPLQNLELFFTV